MRPYIGVALGVTRLIPEPSDLESETRFSASFAGGLKVVGLAEAPPRN